MHEQTQPMPSVDGEPLEQQEHVPSVDGEALDQTEPLSSVVGEPLEQAGPMPSVDGEPSEQTEPLSSVDGETLEQTEHLPRVDGETLEQIESMPIVNEPSEQTEHMPVVNESSEQTGPMPIDDGVQHAPNVRRRPRQRQLRPIVGDQPNGEGRRRQRKRQKQSDEVQHVHNLREVIDEASLPEHTEPLCTMHTEPPLNNDLSMGENNISVDGSLHDYQESLNNDPSMGEDSISVDGSLHDDQAPLNNRRTMILVARIRGFDNEGPVTITSDDLIDTIAADVITLLNDTFLLPSNFNSWGYTDSDGFHLINNLDVGSIVNIIQIPGIVFEATDEDYSAAMTYFLNRLRDDSCRNKVLQGINFILASSRSNRELVKKQDDNGISYSIQRKGHHPN